jgi:GNAT superfamily N-acetyltransferase
MNLRPTEIRVRSVRVHEILSLRHCVLRRGLPRETATFPDDNDACTSHLAAFSRNRLIGCVTLICKAGRVCQLRGMAVAEGYQGQGVGRALLAAAERVAIENGAESIWANCRIPAVPFYEKFGWTVICEEFFIETLGPHRKMRKLLSPPFDGRQTILR